MSGKMRHQVYNHLKGKNDKTRPLNVFAEAKYLQHDIAASWLDRNDRTQKLKRKGQRWDEHPWMKGKLKIPGTFGPASEVRHIYHGDDQ